MSSKAKAHPISIEWRVKNHSIPLPDSDTKWTLLCTLAVRFHFGKRYSPEAEALMIVKALDASGSNFQFRIAT